MKTKHAARLSPWHVSVAAEAAAATLFARAGFDVSVQYGANQPEYDLIVARRKEFLKVSVKGSQTGSWGLTQSYLRDGEYHAAARLWLRQHSTVTAMCLVQFKDVPLDEMPRVYIATPREVAARLKDTAKGRGATILYEHREWTPRAQGAGTTDRIPDVWRFSRARVEQLLSQA